MQEIVLSLDERGRNGARTTMVKVHGHTGEPLHAVADAMPTEGADRKMEVDDTRLSPSSLRTAVSPLPAPAGLPLPGYEISPPTFLRFSCLWIRSLTKCDTPHCYLVARTYKKWRMKMDDSCLCGEGAGTVLHMQLACKLKSRRAAIQGAHDDVMRVMEEEVMREVPPGRRAIIAIPYTVLLIAASCKSRSSHGQYTRSSTEHLSYGTYLPQGIYGARLLSQRVRGGRLAHFCT